MEGAVAIPSYAAVKKRVSSSDLEQFRVNILGAEHQQQLRDAGDIIPTHPDVAPSSFTQENDCRLLYPEWDFYKSLDHEEFDALCRKYSPYKI